MSPSPFSVDFLRRVFNILSIMNEYEAVRSGTGILDIRHRGWLKLHGKDVRSFLHALATQDFKNLQDNTVTHTAFTNAKARMVADAIVYAFEDFILLSCERMCAKPLLEHLGKYLITEDVVIEDVTEAFFGPYIMGKNAVPLIEKVLNVRMDTPHTACAAQWQDTTVWCGRKDLGDLPGVMLFVDVSHGAALWKAFLNSDITLTPFDMDVLEMFRIEAGIPRFGVDVTEENIFPETGMEDAVSYTKGCYLGQETVIRVKHQGQVNRKIAQIKINTTEPVRAGTKVYEGTPQSKKEGGVITSCCFSPRHNAVFALATLRKECLLEWANVFVETQNGILPVQILKK